ncbi:MAG: Nramp family divalent metal transporter [Proteobacteria bacterium]|nr:Nramp family divalent metal transporter [Pseudomonadota bacterium]
MAVEQGVAASERPVWSEFVSRMGPAWIVSAVACGPATMASVSIAGGLYGYQVLWVIILSALLAFVAQFMAAKIGLLSGRGIISLVESTWGGPLAWILMIDALAATWLASTVLMKALADVTGLVTGFQTPLWPLIYAVLIFLLVGFGGYKLVERICKVLVALVVLCFVVTVVKVAPDLAQVVKGLAPRLPGGVQGALMMAGIMGGAVHVTIIGMHTYNVNARGWKAGQMRLAWTDTFLSMFVAFGLYSVAIFLAAGTVLHPRGIEVRSALDLARVLQPLLGPYANAMLLAGIWAAVLSTIMPTFLAAGYFLADKMKWELSVKDARFKAVVGFGCLLSLVAPLLKGSFLYLLVTMLAFGLCGTPLILLLLLILLNRKDTVGDRKNGLLLNVLAILALLITTLLAARFLAAKLGF